MVVFKLPSNECSFEDRFVERRADAAARKSTIVRDRDSQRVKSIGGFPIRDTDARSMVRYLDRQYLRKSRICVAFANHNFVVTCRHLRGIIRKGSSGFLLLNDGIGVGIAAKLVSGSFFKENMNGTDFVPLYLRESKKDLKIYLLGGKADVVQRARRTIEKMPNRSVVGAIDGFAIWEDETRIIRDINLAKPDVLLVGLGNPKQEEWIARHRSKLDVSVVIAVGALFEWMTGTRNRAPAILRRCYLEWFYRLVLEPRRLLGRYTVRVVKFFAIVVWDAILGDRSVEAMMPLDAERLRVLDRAAMPFEEVSQ